MQGEKWGVGFEENVMKGLFINLYQLCAWLTGTNKGAKGPALATAGSSPAPHDRSVARQTSVLARVPPSQTGVSGSQSGPSLMVHSGGEWQSSEGLGTLVVTHHESPQTFSIWGREEPCQRPG